VFIKVAEPGLLSGWYSGLWLNVLPRRARFRRSLGTLHPQRMITGFNPADMYAADHIRRVLEDLSWLIWAASSKNLLKNDSSLPKQPITRN
jgi:hypothetical protein